MAKTSILNWLKSTTRRSKRSSRRSSGSNSSTGGQRSINASSSSDGRISTKDERSKTSDDDNSSIRRGHKDNGKVPESILLSQSEDEDENSTKSNSDKDKPLSTLKKFGFTDRAARELRKGMKEAGGKAGEKVKEGIKEAGKKASEKVKEGIKEAGAKIGEKVIKGMQDACNLYVAIYFLSVLIMNYDIDFYIASSLGAFLIVVSNVIIHMRKPDV